MKNLARHLSDTQAMAKLVGEAPVFLKAIGQLPEVAKSSATVLISGETGTGKELVARAIHYLSENAAFPFVPVNCGSFSDTLLADELFGHERGAFTDAHVRRTGLIAQASKGTLFLDEVDTLTPNAQVTLLRVLQDKRIRAIGSSCEQPVVVRVVAATNAILEQLVRAGTFRADLYYRLCVFSIRLPPLRERKEDIPILASHFLKKHTPATRAPLQLAPPVPAALLAYDWPGNVRELESAILRGIYISRMKVIDVDDLGLPSSIKHSPDSPSASPAGLHSFKATKQKIIAAFERDYLIHLMNEHQGNISRAARAAGKERRDLGKLLKKHRLNRKLFSPGPTPSR